MNVVTKSGLPAFERLWLGSSLKFAASFASPIRVVRSIESVGRKLVEVAEHAGTEDAFQLTRVPRMIGIDYRATNWSVVMAIDHLKQFNGDVIKIIHSLQQDLAPRGEIAMSDYHPDSSVTWEAVEEYRKLVNELSWLISGDAATASNAMFQHPWYGPLTAHQWLCCVALHQYVHLRQVRRIVAIQGVT